MLAGIGDLLIILSVGALGVFLGWWMHGGIAARITDNRQEEETRWSREIVARLQKLTIGVAADVGVHNNQVEAINEELAASNDMQPVDVLSSISKLMEANQSMQERLIVAEDRLEEQANEIESRAAEARTDPLTGLANRRAFDDELSRRAAEFRRHGRIFSLMLIDIDHFKEFNDQHGHQAGDEVLRAVGNVLRRNARDMDLVARYGGEEFAVIMPGTNVPSAKIAAERTRKAVESAVFPYNRLNLRVTVCVGVAEVLSREDIASLIERTDVALYAAKQGGRNLGFWHDGREAQPIPTGIDQKAPSASASGDSATQKSPKAAPSEPAEKPTSEHPVAKKPPKPVPASEPDIKAEVADRTAFCEVLRNRLAEWRRGGLPPSLLLIRIDELAQRVADYGEPFRDVAFRTTIRLMRTAVREMDTIARFDDESFAILLPGARLASLVNIAERLREAASDSSLSVEGTTADFTLSVGGAEAVTSDDPAGLARRTQEALDEAANAGGNRSFFHTGLWSETVSAALETASGK